MSQTETGKHLFENISEEGRISFDELLLENGRIILWNLQSVVGSVSATSNVTGTLSVSWSLKGDVSAVSSVSGTLTGGWALKGVISATSSVQGILSHAAPERGFYYAKLGSTILTSIEKDSFRITEELNKIPSFEFEIANCSDNRTTIAAGITDVFTIYRLINGTDTLMFTGIINGDAIEYLSLERIRITGYASYIDLNWRFHQHLNSEDAEDVNKVFDYDGTYTDYTTAANNDTINDVFVTFGDTNQAFYIGENNIFGGAQIKYSTAGIADTNSTIVIEYSKGSSVWATLDVLDESEAFTKTAGTYYLIIPHLPSDWARDAVNGVTKYWIRYRLTSVDPYILSPRLDRIKITNIDVYRVYYFETAANSIMDDVLAGTGYSMDVTDVCPADEISIVAEYETKLRLIAGVANALTWDDSGDKKAYQWWIDTSKKVHFKQKRGATLGDITAELTILNNIEDYFNLSNRLHFLGNYDGRFQLRAIIENTASQDTHELRELAVPEERYNNYIPLKEAAEKAMTHTKAPLQKIAATVTTKYWLDEGFEVGDTVTLHKDTWNVDSTAFQIVRADVGPRVTNLDMGISQEHLDGLKAGLQRQLDISGIRMHGSTSLLQFGPETSNYQRVDTTTVYPSKLKIEIPSDVRYIHKVLLSWTIGPYHADVTPDTSETDGHDHTGYTGADGAHDHTGTTLTADPHLHIIGDATDTVIDHRHVTNELETDGNTHTHIHNLATDIETDHAHTNPNTGEDGAHNHANAGYYTGYESSHTHPKGSTGLPDDTATALASVTAWGSSCDSGWCVQGFYNDDFALASHYHLNVGENTGAGSSHRHEMNTTSSSTPDTHHHTQGNTGVGGAHDHAVTGTVGNLVSDTPHTHLIAGGLTDYVYMVSGDFKHGHTIPDSDTAGGEARGIISEGTHNQHVVVTEPGESVIVQYGIHEIAAGTTLELLVNSEVVSSSYVGNQEAIRIDGYLSTGVNTVEIRPIITETGKKGSCAISASGLVFLESKNF